MDKIGADELFKILNVLPAGIKGALFRRILSEWEKDSVHGYAGGGAVSKLAVLPPAFSHGNGVSPGISRRIEDSVVSPLPPVDTGIKNLYRGPLAPIGIEEKGGADPYQVLPRAFLMM